MTADRAPEGLSEHVKCRCGHAIDQHDDLGCIGWHGCLCVLTEDASEDGRTVCEGCVTDADRVLWTQLATEYAAQLARHREDTLL